MASFDANINLNVDNSKALKGVNDVEKAVKRLGAATDRVRLKVEGAREAEQAAARLYKALERLESAALSKLPRSVQLLVAYLKAANAGMAELSSRAALAAVGIGEIGKVNFAPLIRQTKQVRDLLFEIQQVRIKFLDQPSGFRPRLEGGNPFQKLLDGLDLVKVRVLETERILEGFTKKVQLLNGAGGGGGRSGGDGGGGGGSAGSSPRALPPADFSFLGNPNTLRGLRSLRASLENLLDTAVIGSRQFRRLEDAIAQVNNQIKDAQLKGQRGGSGVPQATRSRGRRPGNRRFRDIATGVGFSALFGGGLGEILGGGLGAGVGGLGGSLIGSVIGRAFDDLQKQATALGAALNATTFDAQKLSEAFGTQGSSIKRLLEETKEVAGASVAAEQAAALLATSIGDDAVQSFNNLDEANRRLGDALAQLNTELAAVAATIAGPLISALAGLLERANAAEASARILREGGPDADRLKQVRKDVIAKGGSADDVNVAQQAEAVKILEEREQARLQTIRDTNIANSKTLEILKNEEKLLSLGSDLLNDQVYELEKQNIELRTKAKLNKENLTDLEKEIIKQERLNELKGLENKRNQATQRANADNERAAARAAREAEAAARKEQQVRATLLQLAVQEGRIIGQTLDVSRSRLQQVQAQLQRLNTIKQLQANAILASTEDFRIQQARLTILDRQTELEREKLEYLRGQLILQGQLQTIQSKQQVEGLSRGLNQELERASLLPSGNQFADQLASLDLEQTQRYKNTLAEINNQIENQEFLLKAGTDAQQADAKKALNGPYGLRKQKQVYESLLPQIFAAEQQQLKFNQALELAQGPVNAFVNGLTSGLQGIIDGTKSVEEAFADMLRGIADALVQTATQMIAQYIAIGIARAFAGIPSGGGSDLSGANSKIFGLDAFGGLFSPGGTSGFPTGFANGGRPEVGKPAIVGERGPELFIPDTAGTVIPNDEAFNDARSALVDVGSRPATAEEDTEAFAVAAGALARNSQIINNRQTTTQQETSFNNFTEAMMRPGQSTVKFETVKVGAMEMVTKEEALEIGARSAKAAEANVFSALRNKPSVRRSIGMS